MEAGESAYDVAKRQREMAERLQRSAALWERGAEGEVAVARALEALPDGWVVLHDLAWPGRKRANIDHVVVGPGGVFVVDAKNWSGRVEIRDQVLMQNGRRREPAVVSAAEAAIGLQSIVPPPASCMGVLCFVHDDPLTGWARDVMVCSTSNVATMLLSRPSVLSAEDVRRSVDAIRLMPTGSPPASGRLAKPRPSTPSRTTAKRRRGHPVAVLVGALVLLFAVSSGGLAKAGGWLGERMVEVIAPTDPVEPTPSQPAKQREQKQQKQENKQLDGQQSRSRAG
ncbi:nuclease-related domain-containing protein [Nocardioides eburneiflavus]|nr:nuclease-related domain-containing protein [Nocardioides eburneiflavus]